MNVLITNVSKVTLEDGKTKNTDYVDEQGNCFEGCMTNEAPIKSVIKRLQADNQRLDKIIYIESDTVRKNYADSVHLTHSQFLRNLINRYCEENGYQSAEYDETLDSIRISDEPNAEEVSESVFNVYNRVVQLSQQSDEVNIYIESNGGIRYVLSMLLSITKTLEMQLENVHIKEILSMVFNKKPTRIRNTKSIFDTTQIIGIVDEYVNYGRVNSLRLYTESLFREIQNEEMKAEVDNIIFKLSQLSDDIQLCRTLKMLDDFYAGGGIGATIQEFCDKYNDNTESEIVIFKYLLMEIYSEYQEVIYDGSENYEETVLNLPKVIRWCVKKDFMQQALTLCAERIPQYLFASGRIELSEGLNIELDKIDTKRYEKCYYFISNLTNPFMTYLNVPKVNYVIEKIKKLDKRRYLSLYNPKWSTICGRTDLSCDDSDGKLLICAKQVYKVVEQYMNLPSVSVKNIASMFEENGIEASILDKKVKVSNNYSSTVIDALMGKCYSSKKEVNTTNLSSKETRMIVVLPQLINWFIKLEEVNIDEYDNIVEDVFNDEYSGLAAALKKKYSMTQSEKYYIKSAMRMGHVKSNLDDVKLQRILYLFSLCKEQRNLSNHAYVSEDDMEVAMNSHQLSILISSLLEIC